MASDPTNVGTEHAERRQLTVIFCDLVGSTALAEKLDHEDLRDAMRRYQALVAEAVTGFDGKIASHAGDGLVSYFGHPLAHEDAAERAVRSGLAITDAIGGLETPTDLKVRIGIATGLAIVGGVIESGGIVEREVIGTPPNLAARLQKLAAPNGVVVSASTRHVAGDAFLYQDLGEHSLEGISAKVRAFAVLGENTSVDRFEARSGGMLLPTAGRERERAALLEQWARANSGIGRTVFVSGEPGIGKSHLVRDLREQLSGQPHRAVIWAGSPVHQHSSLYPVAHWLRRTAGIDINDTMDQRRAKLDALLKPEGEQVPDDAGLIADLVATPGNLTEPPAEARGRRREQLLAALVGLVETFARARPLLLVFEDVQWIDPTTRELLDRLMHRLNTLPVLLLVTFRTGHPPPDAGRDDVTTIALGPLDRQACVGLVKSLAQDGGLQPDVAERIVARTDGIPLFIEELTRALLEADGHSGVPDIPETLRDTLMARLGRDGDARSVAQVAAAIGREFSYELLAMIAPMHAAALQRALDGLRRGGLIFQRGRPPRATYVFKHALIQEIAYESQLRSGRRVVHKQIASALHNYFPETPPEILGHHYAEAGATASAIDQFERAAEYARSRSANAEAAAHFAQALTLLEALSPGRQRDRREFDLQMALGAQLIATKGNAADEVEEAFRRALALGGEVGEADEMFRVLRGLQAFHIVRGNLAEGRALGVRLIAEAKQVGNRDLLLQAHRPHGLCLFYMGKLEAARDNLERALALYDPEQHAEHRFLYGSDPGVLAHANLAWITWFLGLTDRADEHSAAARRLCEQPKPHLYSRAFALGIEATLLQFRDDADGARRLADEVIDLAGQHQFAYWGPWGHAIRGWARARRGEAQGGSDEIEHALDAYRDTGAVLMRPYFLGLLAVSLGRLGRHDAGLAAIDEAVTLSRDSGIRFYEPELHRLQAQLLEASGGPQNACAASLERALELADHQGSRSLALRAATDLCRFHCDLEEGEKPLARLQALVSELEDAETGAAMDRAREILARARGVGA